MKRSNPDELMGATPALLATLDRISRKLINQPFAEIVNIAKNSRRGYRPTLVSYRRKDDEEMRILRAGFNAAMKFSGSDVRAWPETGWQYGKGKKNPPATAKRKRNPDEAEIAAAKLSELFHGRPAKEVREYVESLSLRTTLTHLGRLVELRVWIDEDDYRALGPFKGVDCSVSPDGGSVYFVGGDQSIDLKALGLDKTLPKDHVKLGECDYLAYATEKRFDSFEPITYEHELGEETGDPPTLCYDTLNEKLYLVGGNYRIEQKRLVEDMSPGIVD